MTTKVPETRSPTWQATFVGHFVTQEGGQVVFIANIAKETREDENVISRQHKGVGLIRANHSVGERFVCHMIEIVLLTEIMCRPVAMPDPTRWTICEAL